MRIVLRLAARELRGGLRDFRIFLGCLFIGVAVIAGIGNMAAAIRHGMQAQARTLLGGDLEISTTNAQLAADQLAFLRGYGQVSLTLGMRAMASRGNDSALVEIKGVDVAYPLIGRVQLQPARPLPAALTPGAMIAEPALFDRLDVKVGDTLILGETPFRLAGAVTAEPDRLASAFSLGPQVLVRIDDLARAGLLLPGELIHYNYHLLLRDPAQAGALRRAATTRFPQAPWIIKSASEDNRSIGELLNHLQLFLTLTGLSSLLIGGIGIFNAAESYLAKKYKTIATLKSLGASRNQVFYSYVLVIFTVSLIGAGISAVCGASLSLLAFPYLRSFFPVADAVFIDPSAIGLAVVFGLLSVFSFALAPLARRVEVKPASLFRGLEIGGGKVAAGKKAIHAAVVAALLAVVIASSSDRVIAAGFVIVAAGSLLTLAVINGGLKRLARRIKPSRPWARLALASIHQPGSTSLSMMLSVGIGLTVLIAMLVVEGNFNANLDEVIRAKAPSYFLINIQSGQQASLAQLLRGNKAVSDVTFSPMVRGRIEALNGVPVAKARIESGSKWAIDSDRGFSFATVPPPNNPIARGNWWPGNYTGAPLVSLDRNLAKGMRLHLGDTITVNILGQDLQAKIVNFRDVNYSTFQINFALVFSPGALDRFPASYIATLRLAPGAPEGPFIHDMTMRFPGISAIRTKDSIAQVQAIVAHIATAIGIAALTTLLAGIIVLASAMASTVSRRQYDLTVLKVLGARRSDVTKMFFLEWAMIGLATGIFAAVTGTAGAWLILQRLSWLEFHILPSVALETVAAGMVIIFCAGLAVFSGIHRTRPADRLRNE